jgi:DNA polymerase-1
MQEHGILVDTEGMLKFGEDLDSRIESMQQELDEIAGQPLNINSPKQLKDYFYIKKKVKPYKNKAGAISVDKDVLKRLSRKGFKEAKLIQEMRGLSKLRSTYINLDKIDPDSRIRCSYNPVGTMFSRLSSSENIFGTGMNLQNWPPPAMSFLKPDDGYIYYSFDLSQAENRMVAYIGQVGQMIHAFETGRDVHKLTASLIFGKPYEDISSEDGSCSLGGGEHSERFWGKKANHGLNYDLGYRNFSFAYEIPENEGKFIVERYHSAYPGVRNGYHAYVRQQLHKDRTVVNLMGRRTTFLDEMGHSLYKKAYSCNPQGSTGDIINERGINYIYYNQEDFGPIELLNQIHDSIGFQIPLSVSWLEHARMLIKIRKSLELPLSIHGRDFVIPADLTMGLSLSKNEGIELKGKNFPYSEVELAKLLEDNYSSLFKNLTKGNGS